MTQHSMPLRRHFQEMLAEVERRLADEAGHVERAVDDAGRAFLSKDSALAGKVVEGDRFLDLIEVELERLCLDTLALQQPMATDLRFLAGALKINSDLERMGDLACNVAKLTWRLGSDPVPEFSQPFAELADAVRSLVARAVQALLRRDAGLAREVWREDDGVDERFRALLDLSLRLMKTGGASVEDATIYVAAVRHMERIGDHATNIAEDVVFIVEGRIVRHNVEARIAPPAPEGV
jgi:phosphate transport system protein